MRRLLPLLLVLPLALPAHGWDSFPRGTLFRSPVADPAEPRMFLGWLEVRRQARAFSAGRLGAGVDFGLARWDSSSGRSQFQVGMFGGVDSLFDLDLPSDALVNTDYRFGFPLAWRSGALSARARLLHQSSHLGDELILGGNAPRRVDLNFEQADFLAAWERAGWRLYAGGGHVIHTRSELYRGESLQAGFDYVGPPAIFGQRVTFGVDAKWLEAADWRSGVSAKLGIMIGHQPLEGRGLTLLLEAYDGFAPFGQFFVEDLRYRGVTLQFDF